MTTTLTALLAGTLLSCTTLGVYADDGRHPSTGDGPITRGNGNSGGSSNPGSSGGRDHGFHGDRWQDRVPRTPMWLIHAFTGLRNSPVHPEGNERGISTWWRGDRAVDELLNRVQIGYDYGARWFFVNRPMGTNGFTHVPGASWLTLENQKRDELPEKLTQALLERFDEPVHVVWFIGSEMTDPRDFHGWTPGRDREFYEVGREQTWEQLIGSRVTLGGWISTGASGIAFDASSPEDERGHFVQLSEALGQFPFHLNVYGEAYPLIRDDGRIRRDTHGSPVLAEDAVQAMPWIATTSFIDELWSQERQTDTFPVNPDETRLFVWFDRGPLSYGQESQRRSLVNRYMDMGLIPITKDPVMFTEALNRLGTGANATNSTSRSNGNNDSGNGSGNRIIIRPSSVRRSAAGSNTQERTSVPDQELPERYQNKGTGIR